MSQSCVFKMSIYERAKEIKHKAGFWIEGTQLDYQVSGPIQHFRNPLELDAHQWTSVLECIDCRQHELDVLMGPKPAGAGMTASPCLCGLRLHDLATTDQRDIWAVLARANYGDLVNFYACPVVTEVPTTVVDETEARLACTCNAHAALMEYHVLCRELGVYDPLFVHTDLKLKRLLFELSARNKQQAPAGFRAETADQAPVITTCGVVGYASKRRKTVGPTQLPGAAAPSVSGGPEIATKKLDGDLGPDGGLDLPLPKSPFPSCYEDEGERTPWLGSPCSGHDELFSCAKEQESGRFEDQSGISGAPTHFGGVSRSGKSKLLAYSQAARRSRPWCARSRARCQRISGVFRGSGRTSCSRVDRRIRRNSQRGRSSRR